jgi:hypothetical protein
MSDFVQITVSPFFSRFRQFIEELRDEILDETSPILRKEEEASIRARWYRLGRTLRSLKEQVVTDGPRKTYRLFPTAPHAIFGEYGTGRRGAATGRPAPKGYTYGPKPGMAARRYSRFAVQSARPQIDKVAKQTAREFAKNVTVR